MTTELIRVATEPDPYEQFFISQAMRVGDVIYVSGQASIDEQGNVVDGDFETQARQSFENLSRVLAAGGSSLDNLVKVTIFVTDISKFEVVMKLRQEYFSAPYPADTICEVKSLALPELQFEIEAIALVG